MSFQDKLQQIDRLQSSIEDYGKLGRELLQKINYKFRLDWNYYSNRMEGNTLTIDETKSVMIGNINVHNKPLKDIMEMKGHDDAIQTILQMGKGELNISESRIKGLHKEIMYEDKPAEEEKIGKWKIRPNHVFNYREEKFDFASPDQVPDSMHELVNWVNAEKEKIDAEKKGALHPVELAFDFHLQYLTIHPFYDGNGRTGRILTNLILISYGLPPIYVKDNEKTLYYRYLAEVQAYGADKYMLFELMSDYLIRSQNIVLNAIAGKEIEEPEDIDKKIQLLERELNAIDTGDEVKMLFSKDTFLTCYETWISPLSQTVIPAIEKFDRFFTDTRHAIGAPQATIYVWMANKPVSDILGQLTQQIGMSQHLERTPFDFFIQAQYLNFKKGGLKSFNCNCSILIRFSDFKYEIHIDDFFKELSGNITMVKKYERLLHQGLTQEEINDLATMLGNTIFKYIDYHTKKNGIRKSAD